MAGSLSVSLEELRKAEHAWTDAGVKLANASVKAQNQLSLDQSKVGIFSEFFAIYETVPVYAFDRLSEGIKACGAVSAALRTGRQIYAQQEQVNQDTFEGLN
ncbi:MULTISPECIES: hypothetical protein [unclassified Nocardia]|uniref:hypothetical protein n=1 Tax=unclassified Nocardia TaxID=2637762 RepID=UPI00278C03D8|nr:MULTISPECIES: hypothetical protein [unclassified Nocardia]